MFFIFFKCANKIKRIISFRELDSNISFLTCLRVLQEDGEESAGIHASLDILIIIFILKSALSKERIVFIYEFYLAFVCTFHHHFAESGPYLLSSPIFGLVPCS